MSSVKEAEKRWCYSYLRVESLAVKKRVSCKNVAMKRLCVCYSYSKTITITVLKCVASIQLMKTEKT
jgi:hypothetical protein